MSIQINSDALSFFKSSLIDKKSWKGFNAKVWASYFKSPSELPETLDKTFTRTELFRYSRDTKNSTDHVCIAILSWGGMNREHGKAFFSNCQNWIETADKIRFGKIKSREEAYAAFNLFKTKKLLQGIGPAYFTKLICFLNPSLNGYIMDQWTSKSINILTDRNLIKLDQNGIVKNNNSVKDYEVFCQIIELLSSKVGLSPLDTEEALFSYGGHKKGKWRQFVIPGDKELNTISKKSLNHKPKKSMEAEIKPIDFKIALDFFYQNPEKIKTLGGRSLIQVSTENNRLKIINSKGNVGYIDSEHWERVMNRMQEILVEERCMTSRYGLGKEPYHWKEVPNKVYSIYVPAVVKHITIEKCNS